MLDLFDLSGKVAIVTGGNGGLGKGIALGLAKAGASIVIAARNREKTAKALEEIRGLGVKAVGLEVDVSQEGEVERMVKEAVSALGRVDILVNNAGISVRKMPQEYTLEEWDRVLTTNLTGTFLCCRAVYPVMKSQGGGKVINIGSMMSIFGSDWIAPYAASKGGVVQLTKSLAVAWAGSNIQVNAILPGWFATDLTATIPQRDPERYQRITRRICAGRWGQPSDLEGVAVFLASRASDYVTGAAIPVDGGYSVQS